MGPMKVTLTQIHRVSLENAIYICQKNPIGLAIDRLSTPSVCMYSRVKLNKLPLWSQR